MGQAEPTCYSARGKHLLEAGPCSGRNASREKEEGHAWLAMPGLRNPRNTATSPLSPPQPPQDSNHSFLVTYKNLSELKAQHRMLMKNLAASVNSLQTKTPKRKYCFCKYYFLFHSSKSKAVRPLCQNDSCSESRPLSSYTCGRQHMDLYS